MIPADTARVLTTIRADLAASRTRAQEKGRPWDVYTALEVLALVDQRVYNISTAADFHDRAARSTP